MSDYKWKEIVDLPNDLDIFRDRELEALLEVWREEEKRLGEKTQVQALNTELAREWAIETGIIEGVYTLDRGTTQILIERGIDSAYIPRDATNRDPELVSRIVQAHKEALEGLFAFIKAERQLTAGYIKEVHAALLQHIDTVEMFDQFGQPVQMILEKGAYKKLANSPRREDGTVHEYCPPEHVASEMDRLIAFHQEHGERNVRAYIEAAWLHHAFTQIHPFQDGNGRVARALASLVLIKAGFFPLVVTRDDREKYISALESADLENVSELVRLFGQIEKRTLTKAIGRAVDVTKYDSLDESLKATADMLVNLGRIIPAEYNRAKAGVTALFNVVGQQLDKISARLVSDITQVDTQYSFQVSTVTLSEPETRSLGHALRYDPNPEYFQQSKLLTLRTGTSSSRIVVTFHGIGPAFRGVLAAVVFFQNGDGPAVPLADDIFRISYTEPTTQMGPRFAKWLEQTLIEGMAQWRRTLI